MIARARPHTTGNDEQHGNILATRCRAAGTTRTPSRQDPWETAPTPMPAGQCRATSATGLGSRVPQPLCLVRNTRARWLAAPPPHPPYLVISSGGRWAAPRHRVEAFLSRAASRLEVFLSRSPPQLEAFLSRERSSPEKARKSQRLNSRHTVGVGHCSFHPEAAGSGFQDGRITAPSFQPEPKLPSGSSMLLIERGIFIYQGMPERRH